jgi:hypothetical protein
MREKTPNIITSGLSGVVSQDGVTVDVQIYRLEREPAKWSLEVVNDAGTSTVWDNTFPTDQLAYDEFRRTVAEEGMMTFVGGENVIPFRR